MTAPPDAQDVLSEFIRRRIANGNIIVSYKRKKTLFGNEAEFRWKDYHNSANVRLKVSYNVPDEDHEKCERMTNFYSHT